MAENAKNAEIDDLQLEVFSAIPAATLVVALR
jgi:hypothetical protein